MTNKYILFLLFICALICIFTFGGASVNIAVSQTQYVILADASVDTVIALAFSVFVLICVHKRPRPEIDAGVPVGLFKRFIAFLIDFLLNLIVVVAVSALVSLLVEGIRTGRFAWSFARFHRVSTDIIIESILIMSIMGLLVLFALPVYRQRQSLGQAITGYVVISGKERVSLFKALLRCILSFISCALFFVSCPMVWFRKDRRMWHDLLFNTYPCKVQEKT